MTFDEQINLVNQITDDTDEVMGDHAKTVGAATINTSPTFDLWCDYIYLDTDERRRFAQVSHEYLIEQLQFQYYSSASNLDLNFNHPVKELIWTNSTWEGLDSSDNNTEVDV